MSIRYILRVWPHHTRIQGQQRLKQACLILRWCYRRFLCSQLRDFSVTSLQLRLKSGGLMTSETQRLPFAEAARSALRGPTLPP